jgi:two-component system, LytTR family, sensor histidine kinase AgrC
MKKNIDISSASVMIIALNIIQIAAILVASAYTWTKGRFTSEFSSNNLTILLFVVLIFVLLNSFITIRDRYFLSRVDKQYHLLKDNVSQIENLNNTLRAQRHDFLNHLQVVYSLMEMEEYKEANGYIEKVYIDIRKVSRLLRTSNPAVNALLQAKALSCENSGIKVEVKVSSILKDMGIDAWELCRVLGNLLDNSIYALKEIKADKYISMEISEDLVFHKFKITNNGPEISKKLIERIFEPGFTTKGEHGEGMGLCIVSDIVKGCNGSIEVQSSPSQTTFDVAIPKKYPQIRKSDN